MVGLLAPAVTVATGGVCRGGPSRAYTCCVNPMWKLYLGYTISHESGEQTRAGSCNQLHGYEAARYSYRVWMRVRVLWA